MAWRRHARSSKEGLSQMVRRAVNGVVPGARKYVSGSQLPKAARRQTRQGSSTVAKTR